MSDGEGSDALQLAPQSAHSLHRSAPQRRSGAAGRGDCRRVASGSARPKLRPPRLAASTGVCFGRAAEGRGGGGSFMACCGLEHQLGAGEGSGGVSLASLHPHTPPACARRHRCCRDVMCYSLWSLGVAKREPSPSAALPKAALPRCSMCPGPVLRCIMQCRKGGA